MKKILSENLTLYFENFFPYHRKKISNKRYITLIGVGGNIGDVKRRFKKLFLKLYFDRRVDILSTSAILKNPPFGFLDQPYFFNAVVLLKTNMSLRVFFKFIMHLEKRFKRERLFKNSPRTIDIDIIFFDKISYQREDLQIPHPKWHERESVIIPMLYLKD